LIRVAETSALARTRCLVTGGAGFIGSNLTRFLLEAGSSVTVLDNFVTGRPEHLPRVDNLTVIHGNIVTFAGIGELCAESDFVFHLAAQVGNVKSLEETETDAATNILGSVRLLKSCRGTRLRKLVYSSSSAIFGEAERLPIDESHPQRPASFYALSKLAAERYALLAREHWNVPAVCLRYFNVFGLPMENNEYTGVISIFFNRLKAGQPLTIYGDGEQLRDFVYVRDVARANVLAALRAEPGSVFNIGTGVASSVRGLALTMRDLTGQDVGIHYGPSRSSEVRRSVADIGRARAGLGFEPGYDLRQGLAEMWEALAVDSALPR